MITELYIGIEIYPDWMKRTGNIHASYIRMLCVAFNFLVGDFEKDFCLIAAKSLANEEEDKCK